MQITGRGATATQSSRLSGGLAAPRRRFRTRVAALVAGTGLLVSVFAMVGGHAASAQSATPSYVVAAEGSNGQLMVQTPDSALLSPGWQSLGGQIIAAPAVATYPDGSPLFIALGTDHALYDRTLSVGWAQLGPYGTPCMGSPAATVTQGQSGPLLTVACEGGDQALYAATLALPSSGPPVVNAFSDLGGVDVVAMVQWLGSHGLMSPQRDHHPRSFGELWSTSGVLENFQLSRFPWRATA
jgi:hypothetical protein